VSLPTLNSVHFFPFSSLFPPFTAFIPLFIYLFHCFFVSSVIFSHSFCFKLLPNNMLFDFTLFPVSF
jgi:hypothetical protein